MDNDKKPVFIVDGQEVDGNGKPLAEAGKPEIGVAEVEGLRQELAAAQRKVDSQAEIIERGTADNKRLIRETGASNDNSFKLKAELDKANRQLAIQKTESDQMEMNYQQSAARGGQEREKLQGQIAAQAKELDTLKGQRNDLQALVTEGLASGERLAGQLAAALARPVMPADARERLIAVNGINAALADKALDALKTDPGQ